MVRICWNYFGLRSRGTGPPMTNEGNGFWIRHSYNRDRWLEGNISEVRIWNKVLTSAEINAKDHFYQVEPDADGLVSYWKFDGGRRYCHSRL